jgi:phage N-6-adenine-methyltransferase
MNKLDVHFSSVKSDWETPKELFNELNMKYGPLELDVCASDTNTKCSTWFIENALEKNWVVYDEFLNKGTIRPAQCWMNPPYGRGISKWIKKAYEESLKGCRVVCLLPARTDTKWFHDYCMKGKIEFLRGRVKFVGAKHSAPFPSMVVVFG